MKFENFLTPLGYNLARFQKLSKIELRQKLNENNRKGSWCVKSIGEIKLPSFLFLS